MQKFWWLISLVVLGGDLFSKYSILNHLAFYEIYPLCPHLNFCLAFNSGAAFSFLANAAGWQRWLFLAISVFISIFIYYRQKLAQIAPLERCGLALILGGALGNAWDRFYYHFVIDFIDVYWGNWHYPTFNIADIAITCGLALLFYQYWWRHTKN